MGTTNTEAWTTVTRYRDELNSNSRKIGFAGAALTWTLQTETGVYPIVAVWALVFFVGFFLLDLLQLYVGFEVRRSYIRRLENERRNIDGDFTFSDDVDIWPFRLFLLKLLLLAVAYILLGVQLVT